MNYNLANVILIRLKEGQYVSFNENPETIRFLENLKLVEVYNKKVLLTHTGGLAAGMGLEDYLEFRKVEKDILRFSIDKGRRKRKTFFLAFLILLFLFFIAFVSNLSFLGIF